MNKEVEDALHLLLHCSLKDTEYETQFEQYKIVRDYITNLQQENKQLKEDLRVSQSNEETYELEMQEITKILGLDEDTLFDDVKDYAKQVKEQLENKIDLYEDTISYQLGFDKGKEKYYQALLDIKEYIESNLINHYNNDFLNDIKDIVNKALGDKENE